MSPNAVASGIFGVLLMDIEEKLSRPIQDFVRDPTTQYRPNLLPYAQRQTKRNDGREEKGIMAEDPPHLPSKHAESELYGMVT